MASSVGKLSRLLVLFRPFPNLSHASVVPFSTTIYSHDQSDHDNQAASHIVNQSISYAAQHPQAPPSEQSGEKPEFYVRQLENGLDHGIYKAIVVGKVGQTPPVTRKLKSGRIVTLFSVGTGGIHINRIRSPPENEEPKDFANRCDVQWHRVSVYPARLGDVVVKQLVPGSIIYLEGNLETKVFIDPNTGLVRQIREIAIRSNGRIVFLDNSGGRDDHESSPPESSRRTGYH